MRRRVWVGLAVAGLGVATLSGWKAGLADADPAPVTELRVGTVDFVRIFESHPTLVAGKQELQRRKEAKGQEIRKLEQGLESLRTELSMLDPDSDAFREKSLAFEIQKLRYQNRVQVEEKALRDANLEMLHQAMDELEKAVRKVALDHGLTIVLQKSAFRFGGASEEEIFSKVAVRGVVWADESFDVTDEVLARLREE